MFRYLLTVFFLNFTIEAVGAHEIGPTGVQAIDWHSKTISRVVSPFISMIDLGVTVVGGVGKRIDVDGNICLHGHQFNLDINDSYAFDIDEDVTLTFEVDRKTSGDNFMVAYDQNGGPGQVFKTLNKSDENQKKLTFTLNRARFANRGDHGTDLKIAGQAEVDSFFNGLPAVPITICNIKVERSYKTASPRSFGWLELNIIDETGQPTAIKAGIYDETGRSALSSMDSVVFKKFDERKRTFLLGTENYWPHKNHYVTYIDGRYYLPLPVGRHQLVGLKGIEYKMVNEWFDIKAGQSSHKTVKLSRFTNLNMKGWYSGDVHIHSARMDDRDGADILSRIKAEGLNVGNILQMDNVASVYYPQMGFGKNNGRAQDGVHALVSGQEGPRTVHRGHVIHLNINSPIRNPDRYFLYHEAFEEAARQGGLSGYAHAGMKDALNTAVGMAIDVPFGLVKFAEIAQFGIIGVDTWFDFLNLGYKIAPAAGSDYPYLDHPGAYRTYVKVAGEYSVDGWFDGLEAGQSFVTNGPLLELSLNGKDMGEDLRLSKGDVIKVTASASLNPDIDQLLRIELIMQGEIIASKQAVAGDVDITIEHEISAKGSSWLVVRAVGKRTSPRKILAVSSPVYIIVDDETRTWKRQAVPNIVSALISKIDAFANSDSNTPKDHSPWETGPAWKKTWKDQINLLRPRIAAAKTKLREIAVQAAPLQDAE